MSEPDMNTRGRYVSKRSVWLANPVSVMLSRIARVAVTVFLLTGVCAGGQGPLPSESDQSKPNCGSQVRSTYLLGPDDQLEISGPELTEVANKVTRIDGDGDIQVPLVGRVHVSGLTAQQT